MSINISTKSKVNFKRNDFNKGDCRVSTMEHQSKSWLTPSSVFQNSFVTRRNICWQLMDKLDGIHTVLIVLIWIYSIEVISVVFAIPVRDIETLTTEITSDVSSVTEHSFRTRSGNWHIAF